MKTLTNIAEGGQSLTSVKKIQFSYKGMLLHFDLCSRNQVLAIKAGFGELQEVNPMSREFDAYRRILKSKLGRI
jgi:hypothetical protein